MGNLECSPEYLKFNYCKSFDLEHYSKMIENEKPFCDQPIALMTSSTEGSVIAMNTKFAKEYGFSSPSDGLIKMQHFACSSKNLLNFSEKKNFFPEKQKNGKLSLEYAREHCKRAIFSNNGSIVFNWTFKDAEGNEKERSFLGTCCSFENIYSFQLTILGEKEENLNEKRENEIIEKNKQLSLPLHVMDTNYLKSLENHKPLFSGKLSVAVAKPTEEETPLWRPQFCQIDYLGLKINLFKNQEDETPCQAIRLLSNSNLIKSSEKTTSTFGENVPNLTELKSTNQRTTYFSSEDSKLMQSFQYSVNKAINNRKEHEGRSLHYILSKHIDNVMNFDWMKSFELYYDDHIINTDNLKNIRVGKNQVRDFIGTMNNYEWIGGANEARKVGRILVDEDMRMTAVEWCYHYKHPEKEGKTVPKRKIMMILSYWNEHKKIFREDVFYPKEISLSQVSDVDELAKISFSTQQEMLQKMRHKYKSVSDIEVQSTSPTVERICQLMFDENKILQSLDECYDHSSNFIASEQGKQIYGFSNFYQQQKQEIENYDPKLSYNTFLVEGPLGLVQFRSNYREGKVLKEVEECDLFLIKDNKVIRRDRFFD